MVDRSDIPKLANLYREKTTIASALDNLSNPEGRIISMTISAPISDQMGSTSVSINTTGWEYPPQMVEAIKQNLMKRQEEIQKELSELGVTG